MDNQMYCSQCQETAGGVACTRFSMSGKTPQTAAMQDLLVFVTRGLAAAATRLHKEKKEIPGGTDRLITENLYRTMTNADFDQADIEDRIEETLRKKEELLALTEDKEKIPAGAFWTGKREEYASKAKEVGILSTKDEDVRSFRQLITLGTKGLSAFLYQAAELGSDVSEPAAFIRRALSQTLDDDLTGGNLLALVMETGRYAVKSMSLLDGASRKQFGEPKRTKVRTGVRNNPAILVSGHDLHVLELVLKETEGTGIDVYTHDELLSAHAYPKLKKYPHLAGNYGGAWWQQKEEFEKFRGPVLVTSNVLVPPKDSYKNRLFTTGCIRFPGVKHLEEDLSELIGLAKTCGAPEEIDDTELEIGFGLDQLFSDAVRLTEAYRAGEIRKFVFLGGGDGRSKARSYYTNFAKALPGNTMILTSGSAKYRFNKLEMGEIGGLPRILDAGQCSDLYSIIQLTLRLREEMAFDNLNQLPFVYNMAWYEQKDLAALLALLYLDVKHIRLGPTWPAFIAENVRNVFVKYFGLEKTGLIEEDIETMLGSSTGLIRPDMIVADIVNDFPSVVPAMLDVGLHCISCGVSQMETLEEACVTHGLDVYEVLDMLNDELAHMGE